jgi:4'-phosphopantetheinyl transferase
MELPTEPDLLPSESALPIRVWHAASSSNEPGPLELCCEAWLDESDRQRASRFRQPTSRNQHVVGRGMARRLLGSDAVNPQSIRFAAEVYGKPYVKEPAEARQPFNVAHTDGLVMCGIGNDAHELIGVDVERLNRRTDPAIADRYFSKPEVRYLNTYRSDVERRDAFLRIWTLKESFIKAIGTGLQTPLADFAFEEIDSDSPKIKMLNPNLDSGKCWTFFSIQPRPGFIGAIAVAPKRASTPIELELQSFDELMD